MKEELGKLVEERDRLLRYESAWKKRIEWLQSSLKRRCELVVLWQGKHSIVKHENNKLRRKMEYTKWKE
jgi:hypothetical protein